MSKTWKTVALLGAVGAYPFFEARRYGLDKVVVPVGPGVPELDVLHISDLHLARRDARRAAFVASLPDRIGTCDLVLATGDLIEDNSGIDIAAEVLNAIEARLGRAYVLGSHDYYQARFRSYAKYWAGGERAAIRAPRADSERLESLLRDKGWIPLTNDSVVLESGRGDSGRNKKIRLAGVDDPYLGRQRTDHISRSGDEVFAIGLVHSPDVVSEWALAGFDLVVAGHTHGGQVRLPGIGAVVTNCSLPTGLSVGLNRVGGIWLHVSPGLGTGRFQPIRFNCPPRVTLLSLRRA